jgi:hypothetical protein
MRWLSRFWFPAAVVALAVLALPGLALFALHVAGEESAVNAYLEEHYRLNFHVALPTWAAGLLLAVPFLLILLYFLKLKRKPLSVPSTFLWRKSIEDLRVNSLFQWLRRNVLLLLQLLAVLGLIYGILAPRFFGRAGPGRRYVVLVDNSASMAAADVAPSRLEQAKAAALAEIDAAGDGDAGMVIAFNAAAEIRQSFTTNKNLLRQAVEGIGPTQRPTRIEEALALADSLANPTRSTEDVAARPDGSPRTYVPTEGTDTDVHLFSDGRFADVENFAAGKLHVRFHAIGKPGPEVDNVSIVGFSAARDEYDPGRLFVTARLLNFRPRPTSARLELRLFADGRLLKAYEKSAELPARSVEPGRPAAEGEAAPPGRDAPGEAAVAFDVPEVDDRQEIVVHARLVEHADAFPLDDAARLVVGVVRRARVLIVGPPNAVLDAFFDDPATRLVAVVDKLAPDQLRTARYRDAAGGDLVIFDRCAPEREDDLPPANTLFIGRPPPPWKPPGQPQPEGKSVERVDQPAVKGWTAQHGLMRYLTGLHEVGIFEALRVGGLPPRTPRLMEGDRDLLLLFTLSRGPYTDAVLAFAVLTDAGDWNTNWPLLPSFPLFLRNVLYTLGNVTDAAGEENVQPGQVKTLRPGAGVARMQVTHPAGEVTRLERGTRADFTFGDTDQQGIYAAAWDGGGRRFAVNLLDADESNLQPRPAIRVGAETVTAGTPDKRPRELWKWFVLAALAVVLLEWWVYNKRVFV